MRDLIWSLPARNDLQRIVTHYSEFDHDLGLTVIDTLQSRAEALLESPFIGAPLEQTPLRKLSVPRLGFVIIYRVADQLVEIARIHHMRENWQ